MSVDVEVEAVPDDVLMDVVAAGEAGRSKVEHITPLAKALLSQRWVGGRVVEGIDTQLDKLLKGQQALLEGLQRLVDGQQSLVDGQQSLVESQQSLADGQQAILEGQHGLVEGQQALRGEVTALASDAGVVKMYAGVLRSGQDRLWGVVNGLQASQGELHDDLRSLRDDVLGVKAGQQSIRRAVYDLRTDTKAVDDVRGAEMQTLRAQMKTGSAAIEQTLIQHLERFEVRVLDGVKAQLEQR